MQRMTLPRFTYVLAMLHLLTPLKILQEVDRGIKSFIRGMMWPRLAIGKLIVYRSYSGPGFPSAEHNCMALHLAQLAYMHPHARDPLLWVKIENCIMGRPEGLHALYMPDPTTPQGR